MVSTANVKKVDDAAGTLFSASGVGTTSSIEVATPAHVGVMAYVASNHPQELVNLAPFGASSLPSASAVPITVKAVRSCHTLGGASCSEGSAATTTSSNPTCASSDASIATASTNGKNCRLDALTTAHTANGD